MRGIIVILCSHTISIVSTAVFENSSIEDNSPTKYRQKSFPTPKKNKISLSHGDILSNEVIARLGGDPKFTPHLDRTKGANLRRELHF